MLDTDSAIVSCGTIIQIKKGVTIRRPLDGYRDRPKRQTQTALNNSLTKGVPSHRNKWAMTSWFPGSF